MDTSYLLVKGSLDFLTLLCIVNLIVYSIATIVVVFDDDNSSSTAASSANMPLIGLCYASLSVVLLYEPIKKLSIIQTIPITFLDNLFDDSKLYLLGQTSPEVVIISLLSTTVIWVVAALISNCSRAFYTLNSLEKGKLEGNDFKDHYSTTSSKVIEFILRIAAIVLFIWIEKSLGNLSQDNDLVNQMSWIGIKSLILYSVLLVWLWKNVHNIKSNPSSNSKIQVIHSALLFAGGMLTSFYLSSFLFRQQDLITYEVYNIVFLITFPFALIGAITVLIITSYYAFINARFIISHWKEIGNNIVKIFHV